MNVLSGPALKDFNKTNGKSSTFAMDIRYSLLRGRTKYCWLLSTGGP